MHEKYRRNLFLIFTAFFVLVSPFLLIYSLGYSFDLNHEGLVNTISINIQTLPGGAEVKDSSHSFYTPVELKAPGSSTVKLNVQKDGYIGEEFVIKPLPETNSIVKINNLALLPRESEEISKFTDNQKPVGVLSNNLVLFEEDGQIYTQLFSFGGLQGKKQLVLNPTNLKPELGTWVGLSETKFWDKQQNLLLFKNNNLWNLLSLKDWPIEVLSLAESNERQLLVLDKSGHLWTFDESTRLLEFVDSGYTGLYGSNNLNETWLLRGTNVIRVNKNVNVGKDFNYQDKIYANLSHQDKANSIGNLVANPSELKVESAFQGLLLQLGESLVYIPDYNKDLWSFLGNDVTEMASASNSVFFINKANFLSSYNLLSKKLINLGSIAPTTTNLQNAAITYFEPWKRVMIYTSDAVYSVWFDVELDNDAIFAYKTQVWIKQALCQTHITNRFEFCLKDRSLVDYKNTNLW